MNLIDGPTAAEGSPGRAPAQTTTAAAALLPGQAGAVALPGRRRDWVPIRSLAPRHRERILAHLTALDERSRYLRFGYAANDSHIARYVDTLDFGHDELFGIFNRRLELIAMAHLAYASAASEPRHATAAEFGVSALPKARRRGFGRRLFEHAMLHARNRGVRTIFIHALSENTAMLKIAGSAGATVERDGSEAEAWLSLPRETIASHIDELVGERLAEFDYRLKHHAHQAENLCKRSDETKNGDG